MAFDFGYWGKYGSMDFYPETEKELRDALDSKLPFDSGWHGSAKEEDSMRVERLENGDVKVACSFCMDEAFEQEDLFCDFLTETELNSLTNEMLDSIRDILAFGDFNDHHEAETVLPAYADFDDVVESAMQLINGCRTACDESFAECIAVTLTEMYGDSERTHSMIEKRWNDCGVGYLFDSPWDSEIGIIGN